MHPQSDLAHWESSVHAICGNFSTHPQRHIPFLGSIQLSNLGGLEVAHIETNAHRVERDYKATQDDRYCFLILQTGGIMGFSACNGEELALKPGEIVLIDSSWRFNMLPQGLIQQTSVHLPRTLVQNLLPGKQPFHKLSSNGISTQMLRNMMQQLRYSNTHFGAADSEGMALQQALASLLQPALNLHEQAPSSLRALAEQHIVRLLQDHRLSPERLADEMHISRRTLYRLFESEGQSIAHRILTLRLDRCSAELEWPGNDALSITDIAFKWGFSDVSQFSRAFKRERGISPREYRQLSLQAANIAQDTSSHAPEFF
ncbi:transcriptional regulator FeaR [Oceanobacter sp. 5_MG-2023]|uniref:transcriptional regulator FeaR n=1 Tax=Oceanobacter sp. 5_MG-2023 TaxID=3062645 RepID=UPI0026E23C47|nr:transcriptional regulator FeaR [Oceanobacter sp. 5_MG-2023]MDO6683257.1 transcriptional regulator FeaR [Oceanobacter sp. 5_MG-2023]